MNALVTAIIPVPKSLARYSGLALRVWWEIRLTNIQGRMHPGASDDPTDDDLANALDELQGCGMIDQDITCRGWFAYPVDFEHEFPACA